MLGVFAEFERSLIQERVKAGMTRARRLANISGAPDSPLTWRPRSVRYVPPA